MMTILSKVTYRFITVSIKIPMAFAEMEKLIQKFTWSCKGPQIAKTILKKNKVGGLTLSDFQTFCKATIIKTVW